MDPLRYAAKFDPFLSLDCARVEGAIHLATLREDSWPASWDSAVAVLFGDFDTKAQRRHHAGFSRDLCASSAAAITSEHLLSFPHDSE